MIFFKVEGLEVKELPGGKVYCTAKSVDAAKLICNLLNDSFRQNHNQVIHQQYSDGCRVIVTNRESTLYSYTAKIVAHLGLNPFGDNCYWLKFDHNDRTLTFAVTEFERYVDETKIRVKL